MNESVEENRLTNEGFWETFWTSLKVPARVNTRGCIDRCLCNAFQKFVPNGQQKKLIEIGAAPGRWMIFFHEKLDFDVDGIEYVASACRKTEENLEKCGIKGKVFQEDLFHNDLPEHSYDAVLSLGFIEHFTDLAPVLSSHISLLKPGGVLILGVPNFRGVHGAVEGLTDWNSLIVHNLDVMTVSFMEQLSSDFELEPLYIQYIGGINPGLITVAPAKSGEGNKITKFGSRIRFEAVRFFLRALSYIRNRITPLDHLNGPMISCYLLGIYRYVPGKNTLPTTV